MEDSRRNSLEIIDSIFEDERLSYGSQPQDFSYAPAYNEGKGNATDYGPVYEFFPDLKRSSTTQSGYEHSAVRDAAMPPSQVSVPHKSSRVFNRRQVAAPPPAGAQNEMTKSEEALLQLFILRASLVLHMCKKDSNRLYHDKEKVTMDVKGDDVLIWVRICRPCARGNMWMAYNYRKYFGDGVPGTSFSALPDMTRKLTALWRLFKMRFSITWHFCDRCQQRLAASPRKVFVDGDDVVVQFHMCRACAEGNCLLTTTYKNNFTDNFI